MTTVHGTDFRNYRLVLVLLTTGLAIATALAVFFAVTRTSAVAGTGPSWQSTVEQDTAQPVDAPCWRPNVPC